jgi:parallel beta-helix repeat protein
VRRSRQRSAPVEPTDGLVITADVTFAPGIYLLPHGLRIAASGVTVDGGGALLVGRDRSGSGVTIDGADGVTLSGLRLAEYHHGIRARQCQDLAVRRCQVTATAEVPANSVFLDIWRPADRAYGGGLLLEGVGGGRIVENDLQHQMVGLLAYDCHHLRVHRNVASYCSGAGFYLARTVDSTFEQNWADYCCRYEPRGERTGHLGADAAGFVAVRGSSRNVFRRNMARLGGDGFFLAGLSPQLELDGCDDNLFEQNDGSYSPNIAFEATFCRGNVFRGNTASHSNYGFWLGFSRAARLEANEIAYNRQAGIAVENGVDCVVRHNRLEHNGHGVLLWSKHVPEFLAAVPENATSRDWIIADNHLVHNDIAIRIAAGQDHGIRPASGPPPAAGGRPPPCDHAIRRNVIRDNRVGIELVEVERTVLEANRLAGNLEADVRST